jgi:hypothetical protein
VARIVDKVAAATVRDGAIVLSCVDQDGRPYYGGPYHPSVFKSHRRPIAHALHDAGVSVGVSVRRVRTSPLLEVPIRMLVRLIWSPS